MSLTTQRVMEFPSNILSGNVVFSTITLNYRFNEILIIYVMIAIIPVYFYVFLLYFKRKCLIT